MLTLVHSAPAGNGTDPPARRKLGPSPSLSLTHDEARRVGAAIKATARAYGGHDVLATVIGVPVGTLYQAARPNRRASGILVIRLAKAAGVSAEAILTGKLTEAGRCTACGARVGGGRSPSPGGAS